MSNVGCSYDGGPICATQWAIYGKDVSHFLHDYKVAMLPCRITERLQVTSFNRIVADGLHGRIRELQVQHLTCSGFEEAMKTTNAIEDSSRSATRRGFEV
jgi:hypothetical protein